MLDGGLDLMYRQALAKPHRPYARVEVWRGGVNLGVLLPLQPDVDQGRLVYSDGGVTATLQSRVSRRLTMTVREDLYPIEDDDLLAPFRGTELHAYRGIQLGDGSTRFVWQVFRGKIDEPRMQAGGTVSVSASDLAEDVVMNGFVKPENSAVGADVDAEWRRLVAEGLPGALFGTSDAFSEKMPSVLWEDDRGRALDEIATSVGALWYPQHDGRFVLRRYAWTVPADPVVEYSDGDGGTVIDASFARSRKDVRNRIVVSGERTDGGVPVYAVAEDNDPSSPTYVGYGVRSLLVKLNSPTSDKAAKVVADAYLRRSLARTETWDVTMIADAALELGDCIGYRARRRSGVVQVVDTITMPLALSATMQVRSRAQVVPLLASLEGASP